MSSEVTHRQPPDFRYRTSAKAVLTADDRVLLVEERHGDGTRFWTLPGGGVRPDETVPGALERELSEELGCSARIQSQLGTLLYAHASEHLTLSAWHPFLCHPTASVSPTLSAGILDARWVTREQLPPNTLLQVRQLLDSVELSTRS